MSVGRSVQELEAKLELREKGRVALIQALLDIVLSETHEQAIERAKMQLRLAGVFYNERSKNDGSQVPGRSKGIVKAGRDGEDQDRKG